MWPVHLCITPRYRYLVSSNTFPFTWLWLCIVTFRPAPFTPFNFRWQHLSWPHSGLPLENLIKSLQNYAINKILITLTLLVAAPNNFKTSNVFKKQQQWDNAIKCRNEYRYRLLIYISTILSCFGRTFDQLMPIIQLATRFSWHTLF